MNDAIGLIETRGYVGLIEASDAMVKAANVTLVKHIQIGGAFVTTIVKGDVGSVNAAVSAGKEAAPTLLPGPPPGCSNSSLARPERIISHQNNP